MFEDFLKLREYLPEYCCNSARYIVRGGEQSYPPPTSSQRSLLYSFFLEGALPSLQRLCDRTLNAPAKGHLRYRPASHFVMVTFGHNPALRSLDPAKKDSGTVGEHEVMIWILTMAGYQLGPVFWIDHLAWFNPYIFVDSSFAMVGGREIYGLPKEWGWISLPENPLRPDHFQVEAAVFPTFGPEATAIRKPVISIQRRDRSQDFHAPRLWRSHRDCFHAVTRQLYGDSPNIVIPGIGLPLQGLSAFLTWSMPMVFLKQFRAIENGAQPCYQAIAEANSRLDKFRGGGPLDTDFDLKIHNFDSHPIVSDLGLGSETPTIKIALWVEFDFTLETGKTITRIV